MATSVAIAATMTWSAPAARLEDPASLVYRTKTSCVAVDFDEAGKGRIVFLPGGASLHVIGPSSCLPGGFEVMFDDGLYNIFEIDLLARSSPICEPNRRKGRAAEACA